MPFIEIKNDDQKILLMTHKIVSVSENDDGTCNIKISDGENYYGIETYNLIKSLIKESKCD